MKKINKISYELRDICVLQSPISYKEHRSDVNPFVTTCGRKTLPIFVAPMAAVTDEKNYKIWIENKITPVIPRSVQNNLSIEERLKISQETFVSFSLSETKEMYVNGIIAQHVDKLKPLHICIDIAHGTLKSLYDICREIKYAFRESVVLMTGNIANPKAYEEYCRCGIDYVRVGIGGGSRCLVAGSKVLMADGSTENIEEISTGDFVMTMNGPKRVLNTFENETNSTIKINNTIQCTPEHKFFVLKKNLLCNKNINEITDEFIKTNGEYVEAKKLNDEYLLVEV